METNLILAWKAGDQVAAEAIYDTHRVRIFRLAYGLLGNRADAEEAMQDTLLYAFTNIERFDENRASFKTWLHTICVSRCRNLHRRKRLSLTALSSWIRELKSGPAISAEIASHNNSILQAVQTLPPKQREAVILRFWADHSFEELATIMDCPISTAKSRVHNAYAKLRLVLSDAEFDSMPQEMLR